MGKRGAPFKHDYTDPEFIAQIEKLAGYGLTQRQIALFLNIDEATLHRNKKRFHAFMQALERGKATAAAHVGQALFVQAKAGNIRAIQWWEGTRLGYSTKQEVGIGGVEGAPPVQQTTELRVAFVDPDLPPTFFDEGEGPGAE